MVVWGLDPVLALFQGEQLFSLLLSAGSCQVLQVQRAVTLLRFEQHAAPLRFYPEKDPLQHNTTSNVAEQSTTVGLDLQTLLTAGAHTLPLVCCMSTTVQLAEWRPETCASPASVAGEQLRRSPGTCA